MEIRDVSGMRRHTESVRKGASVTQLYPPTASGPGSLVALDLWEIEPGGETPMHVHAEEHVLFVLSGSGEISGESGDGAGARLRADSVVYLAPHEAHVLRNTGGEVLRVLASTPLLVRSERMMGQRPAAAATPAPSPERQVAPPEPSERIRPLRGRQTGADGQASAAPTAPAEAAAMEPVATVAPAEPEPPAPADTDDGPAPDISQLMKRGSDLVGAPRPERRRPHVEPEPEEPAEESADGAEAAEDEAEGQPSLMELFVVFDGGSRGNPGQGYGSYLVQAPGRKPVVKRLEFGDNYTNNQAEYDSLINCLQYITERLAATGRSPEQVQLDIRSDSDLVVNQVSGSYKVKEAGLRKRHDQALTLLDQFAEWRIEWHPREESVRLLGH